MAELLQDFGDRLHISYDSDSAGRVFLYARPKDPGLPALDGRAYTDGPAPIAELRAAIIAAGYQPWQGTPDNSDVR